MSTEYAKHETDYIKRYEKLGYTDAYRFINEKLRSTKSDKTYAAKDITIVKEHRYEGMSNPSDMSLLYVLETSDGGKGTLLAGYGPSADADLYAFLETIPEQNIKDKDILPPDAQ
ncbi:hypothetical protein SAMN05421766_102280 [Zobellia uliginosa]|uniref:Phosphoribosylpyrophosphate synthetase n=1 Tax=Zobellia uliginosa TaxID=143224 RepID=A0ABY1KQJ0_9FLAO|nr:hypothetical protein [Zobellia uliginosa]SIS48564.1 hypothetical protein SAMN05421766_102280 [Zobellia uliginosa]